MPRSIGTLLQGLTVEPHGINLPTFSSLGIPSTSVHFPWQSCISRLGQAPLGVPPHSPFPRLHVVSRAVAVTVAAALNLARMIGHCYIPASVRLGSAIPKLCPSTTVYITSPTCVSVAALTPIQYTLNRKFAVPTSPHLGRTSLGCLGRFWCI